MFVCPECGDAQPIDGHCGLDGARLASIGEDVLLGTTIGAYRIARLLGIGGMGRVYKGVHPTIGSRVAIKVLSRECTDRRDLVERFFSEAKAVNLIRHESIVNVLDLAMLPDGRPYIVMEYLDGAPLASILEVALRDRQPLPTGGLARLAVEVLDALAAAHAKGIIHRDLKPDNIFVAPSGRPKVLDFGIAKLADPTISGGGSTRTGSLLGTPHYMSPEQAAGRPVDHRTDLYAMGVILFECTTGQKPFVAESLFDLLRMHVEVPPPSPRSIRPDLDPQLDQLILCALAKTPEQRFATAHAMSLALQQATTHLPPDQWMPITGSGVHRATPSAGWQPTPFTSRAGGPSWQGSTPSRAVPRPSEQPIPPYEPRPNPIGSQSTVSASSGQVQKQRDDRRGARKGLWIGLAGLVAIVVIVAIVLVNRDGTSPQVAAAPPPTEPVADSPEPTSDTQPDPTPDKSAGAKTAPVGKPAGKTASAAASDDDDDDVVDKDIDDAIAELPPDVRTQVRGAVKKKATQPKAEADPVLPPATTTPPTAGAWIEERTLTPGGWNPRRVDVGKFIRFALAEAKKAMPDAQLTRIGVSGVTPDGFANLELPTLASSHGDIELRFISPSHSKPAAGTPVGLPVKLLCEFRIQGEPDGVEITSMFKTNCKERVVSTPRCSAAALWKLALANRAPQNAVANISYYQASMHDKPRFFFDIGFGHDVVFSHVFYNADCP